MRHYGSSYYFQSDSDDSIRSTLVMCFGNVVFYAPPELITARIDTQIMKTILKYLPNAKVSL